MTRILRVTSEWSADTEDEVKEIIDSATEEGGELTKKTVEIKQKKKGGAVIAEHYKVTTQVTYDDLWSDFVSGGKDE